MDSSNPQLHETLARWREHGLLSDEQVDAITTFEEQRLANEPGAPATTRLRPLALVGIVIGLVLVVGSFAAVAGRLAPTHQIAANVALGGVLALLGVGAARRIRPLDASRSAILVSLFEVVALAGLLFVEATLLMHASHWFQHRITLLVWSASAAAMSAALWRGRERPLHLVVLVGATLVSVRGVLLAADIASTRWLWVCVLVLVATALGLVAGSGVAPVPTATVLAACALYVAFSLMPVGWAVASLTGVVLVAFASLWWAHRARVRSLRWFALLFVEVAVVRSLTAHHAGSFNTLGWITALALLAWGQFHRDLLAMVAGGLDLLAVVDRTLSYVVHGLTGVVAVFVVSVVSLLGLLFTLTRSRVHDGASPRWRRHRLS